MAYQIKFLISKQSVSRENDKKILWNSANLAIGCVIKSNFCSAYTDDELLQLWYPPQSKYSNQRAIKASLQLSFRIQTKHTCKICIEKFSSCKILSFNYLLAKDKMKINFLPSLGKLFKTSEGNIAISTSLFSINYT